MNAYQRAAIIVGQSAASGVLGWMLLLAAFEGAYWAGAYLEQRRRDHIVGGSHGNRSTRSSGAGDVCS